MLRFSIRALVALMILASLIAAIYSEHSRKESVIAEIAKAKGSLDSFNHYSVECLPYYRRAMRYDDPRFKLKDQLVAQVEQTQKKIESMPDRHESEVSLIEVATMDFSCFTYAIHVPDSRKTSLTFFAAKQGKDSLESRVADSEFPFFEPLTIDVPAGLSKLEVIQRGIESYEVKGDARWVTVTPKLQIKIDGELIFEEVISKYRQLGSNRGWKPDEKQMRVIDTGTEFLDFSTFRLVKHEPRQNRSFVPLSSVLAVNFRLAVAGSDEESNQ